MLTALLTTFGGNNFDSLTLGQLMFKNLLICSVFLTCSLFAESKQLVKAEILSNVTQTATGAGFFLGIQFDISDDCYTYWKNPGDAGLAPTFNWSAPDKIVVGEAMFPSPKLKVEEGIVNYVYEKKVLFLFPVKISEEFAKNEVNLKVDVNWLVCKEACIPESESLELTIAIAEKQKLNSASNAYFETWRKKVPVQNSDLMVSTKLTGKKLSITGRFKNKVDKVSIYPLTPELLIDHKKGIQLRDGQFSQDFIVDIPVKKADFVFHLQSEEKHVYIKKTVTIPKQQ